MEFRAGRILLYVQNRRCGKNVMENRNLKKALEIFSALIKGEEISRKNKDTSALYDDYNDNAQVYDIVMTMCKEMNLSLYEYKDTLYVSPGMGNKVFGYTNEELKREIGVRVNRELYLCYFIMYAIITRFYTDTSTGTFTEYVKRDEVVISVDGMLASTMKNIVIMTLDEVRENSFKAIAALWEELPLVIREETSVIKAARGSKSGFVKLVFNFMERQELLIENEGRYYPTGRLRALIENYFEQYKGELYNIVKGAAEDATHKQNQSE